MRHKRTHSPRRIWTAARLKSCIESHHRGTSIVVLANREPFRHEWTSDRRVEVRGSSGGLVTALEPVMEVSAGVWVAHGAGTADRVAVDERDGLLVPPANPRYRLRRVWLDEREHRGYYDGFANEGLWPLCHQANVPPVFRGHDFQAYRSVNARFADAVCEETDGDNPLLLVQDYHFALAPRLIRDAIPLGTIVTFWHIPWPSPEDFAACPWGAELLDGLLGSTILGFQTPGDVRNFIATVERTMEADVAGAAITYAGQTTRIRDYPISVEWPNRCVSEAPSVQICRADVRRQLGLPTDVLLGVGVDRLDYSKGLEEKFLAIERLLETHPAYRGRFAFVQIAEPSRASLPAYKALRARLLATVLRINERFGAAGQRPIMLLEAHYDQPEVYRFLRAADVCYVGSLHDGMNLVSKEFVSARDDERGVLILSRFAGAARELSDALIIDPRATDECADTLAAALTLPADEQARRMCAMRMVVARRNIYAWAGTILADAARARRAPSAWTTGARLAIHATADA
jgi:trehalose 6-phosphate synthase